MDDPRKLLMHTVQPIVNFFFFFTIYRATVVEATSHTLHTVGSYIGLTYNLEIIEIRQCFSGSGSRLAPFGLHYNNTTKKHKHMLRTSQFWMQIECHLFSK